MAGHEDVDLRPFFPSGPANATTAQGVNIAVLTTTANVALNLPTNQGDQEIPSTIRLVNIGSNPVYVELGTGGSLTAVVATASIPMLPNSEKTFLLPKGVDHVAAIAGATGNTLYATCGHGT